MKECPNCNYKNADDREYCEACNMMLPVSKASSFQPNNQFNNQTNNGYGNQINKYNSNYSNTYNSSSIVSLVFGILSVLLGCCCPILPLILGIVALITGAISIRKITISNEKGRGLSLAGCICGGLGIVMSIILIVVIIVYWPDIQSVWNINQTEYTMQH